MRTDQLRMDMEVDNPRKDEDAGHVSFGDGCPACFDISVTAPPHPVLIVPR